jgi:hypothetical protein
VRAVTLHSVLFVARILAETETEKVGLGQVPAFDDSGRNNLLLLLLLRTQSRNDRLYFTDVSAGSLLLVVSVYICPCFAQGRGNEEVHLS